MEELIAVIGLLGICAILSYYAIYLNEKQGSIKLFFFMLVMGLIIPLLYITKEIARLNTIENIEQIIFSIYNGYIWIYLLVVAYFLIKYIYHMLKTLTSKREDYDDEDVF